MSQCDTPLVLKIFHAEIVMFWQIELYKCLIMASPPGVPSNLGYYNYDPYDHVPSERLGSAEISVEYVNRLQLLPVSKYS